jgi:hypothetical protein
MTLDTEHRRQKARNDDQLRSEQAAGRRNKENSRKFLRNQSQVLEDISPVLEC